MKTKLLVAAAITVTFSGPALADFSYYVIEDQSTHKCTIVSQNGQPMPSMTETVVGGSGYNSQQEAEVAMRTAKDCAGTPMGGGSGMMTPNPSGPRPYR